MRQIFFFLNVQIKAFGNLAETVETATLAAVWLSSSSRWETGASCSGATRRPLLLHTPTRSILHFEKKIYILLFFYKQFNFFLKVFKEFVILFGNGGRALPISFRIFVEIAGVSVVVDFGHDGRLQFAIINVVPVDTFEPAAWHKATIKFHLKFHLKYRANFESNDRITTLPALPLTVGSTPNGHHSIERNESNILLPFRNGCDRFRPR